MEVGCFYLYREFYVVGVLNYIIMNFKLILFIVFVIILRYFKSFRFSVL